MKCPFDAIGTIGSRPCEISLNKILADRNKPWLTRKILNLFYKVKHSLKSLQESNMAREDKIYFADLLFSEIEKKVCAITGVSAIRGVPVIDGLASHTACCIAAYFKEFKRKNTR